MAKLARTDEALRWLEDIFAYIAEDNPDAVAHRIAYLVKPERVEVLGVFHGALDISRYSL